MRTSEEIYNQVRWDQRFDPARFTLGVNVRGQQPKRIAFPAFVPGGDIPWHRVLFIEADGEVVWDRPSGVDRLDVSTAGRVRQSRLLLPPFFAARTPHTWDPLAGWAPAESAARPGGPSELRVLTWNTLWDRYDSDRIDTARRRPLLLSALREADADVIALQEVEAGLLALLLAADWVRDGYSLGTDPAGRDVEESGVLLLSRLPIVEAGWHAFGPHKAVAAVAVPTATGPVVVAALHLTSDHSENGPARRAAELARSAEILSTVEAETLVLGDFNEGGAGPARVLGACDAWTEVRGAGDETPTFDPVTNPLAAVSSLSGRVSRLDRVLLRGERLGVKSVNLLGTAPTGPDRLFPSDHYGLAADITLTGGPADEGDGLAVAPTARTALAWLPPADLWAELQEVRREHDPQFERWPPHVNLLFGFVPEAEFERAAHLVSRVAAGTAPFIARMAGVHAFGHRDDATVWLDPSGGDPAPWRRLRAALVSVFPRCSGRAEGYTPHLTLGRTREPGRLTAELGARLRATAAPVGELVLLSRRGDEPMRPRATIALGTGEIQWQDDAMATNALAADAMAVVAGIGADDRAGEAGSLARRVADALPGAVVELVGSRRMGCELPGADLDLVAVLPGAIELAETRGLAQIRERVRAAVPEASELREVTGARVPGLRLRLGGRKTDVHAGLNVSLNADRNADRNVDLNAEVDAGMDAGLKVDLVVVAAGDIPPAQVVARRAELGEPAAVALSAISDADAVLAAVGAERATFATLARQVKAWARARGLDSAPHGWLPGLAWAVLAAHTVAEGGRDLADFFGAWAAWDWRRPVALPGHPVVQGGVVQGGAVSIATPTAPVRSCTAQVGAGGPDLLTQELYEAWEVVTDRRWSDVDGWCRLLAPPPMHRRHAAWAVLTVHARPGEAYPVTAGRVRGRVRALLATLEAAGCTDAHAWPWPMETRPAFARYAVGLGGNPPDQGRLAELAAAWCAGLPGTSVEWAAGGDVPTLAAPVTLVAPATFGVPVTRA